MIVRSMHLSNDVRIFCTAKEGMRLGIIYGTSFKIMCRDNFFFNFVGPNTR